VASTIVGRMGGRAWTASDTRLRRQRQCQSIWQLGLFFELLNELDRHHDLGLSFDARLGKCAHLKADLLYALGADWFPRPSTARNAVARSPRDSCLVSGNAAMNAERSTCKGVARATVVAVCVRNEWRAELT
jgi:hypothetical protein